MVLILFLGGEGERNVMRADILLQSCSCLICITHYPIVYAHVQVGYVTCEE